MRTTLIALVSIAIVVPSTRAQSEAWRAHGTSSAPSIGASVAWLADVNGDGVPDYVAGGPTWPSAPGTGHALICSGVDGSILIDLAGAVGAQFGMAVARAADADGDGIDDVAVGAPSDGTGAVYVYSTATAAQLRKLSGPSAGSRFGAAIADLGDVDGDGVRDLAIGAPQDASGGSNLGLAEIASGASGAVIAQWSGVAAGGEFGSIVADAGDLDGDGLHDLLVVEQNDGGSGRLAAYSSATFQRLFRWNLGSSPSDWTASSAGDVNGDAIPDVVVANSMWPKTFISPYTYYGEAWVYDGATGALIRSHLQHERIGSSVCCAGDVDGDGFADYAYAWDAYTWPVFAGNVTIISGLTGAVLATKAVFGEPVLGGAIDTNGDGVPDLLVGRPADGSANSAGAASVFDPITQTFLTTSLGTLRLDRLGRTSALLDDVDGDGTRDLLVGEGGYDGNSWPPGAARILSGVDGSELRVHFNPASFGEYARRVAALPDLDADGVGEYAITITDTYWSPGLVEIHAGATGNLLSTLSSSTDDSGSFGSTCAVAIQPSGAVELAVGCPLSAPRGRAVVYDVATGNVVASVQPSAGEDVGLSICHLGDVDGDGIGDWATGGQRDVVVFSGQSGGTIQTLSGSPFVGNGKPTCGPGDLDSDGTPDLVVGHLGVAGDVDLYSGATWNVLRSWTGSPGLRFGDSLTVIGDVNRDGFNDLLFGGDGHAFLYSGGSGGQLYRFDGAMAGDSFGKSIAAVAAPGSAGSMNGDAIPDVAIGGMLDATNGYEAGRLSLYFLDDLYLQIDPSSAAAGVSVTLTTSGGPAASPAGLFVVGFDSTPLFLPAAFGNLDSQGIWSMSGAVPAGLSGHTITLESITVGFGGKLAITQPMSLTLQ